MGLLTWQIADKDLVLSEWFLLTVEFKYNTTKVLVWHNIGNQPAENQNLIHAINRDTQKQIIQT